MILFKPHHVPMILEGRKTETRRNGKRRWNVGAIHQAKTDYSAGSMFARLKIESVRRQFLGWITAAGARREGYPSVAVFRAAWEKIHGDWDPTNIVWVVRFHLVRSE